MTAMTHSQLPQTSYQGTSPYTEQGPQQYQGSHSQSGYGQLPQLAQQIAQDHVPAQLAQQFVPPQVAQMFVPEHIARQFVPPQVAQQIAIETLKARATLFQAMGPQQAQPYGQQLIGQQPYGQQPFGPQPFGQQQSYSVPLTGQNPYAAVQHQLPQQQFSQQFPQQQFPQHQQQYSSTGASWLTQLASPSFGQLQSGYPQF